MTNYVVNTQGSCNLEFLSYIPDMTATSTGGVPMNVATTATRWSFEIPTGGQAGRVVSTIIGGQRQILSFNFNEGTSNATPQQGLPGQAILSPDFAASGAISPCVTGAQGVTFFQTPLVISQ